jgi:hypothetical protein
MPANSISCRGLPALGELSRGADDLIDKPGQIDRLGIEFELAGFDLREVIYAVGDVGSMSGLPQGQPLILKRASASRPSGQWSDDDYDVLADGVVVGRIFKANAAPVGTPWMWTLAFGHHEDRTPTHGYEATREAAMAAFAKSWRRE